MRYVTGFMGTFLLVSTLAAADTKFALTGDNTSIKFVGTKPGGKHDGGFKTVTGAATVGDAGLGTLKLEVEIDTESLYSDNPKLTAHLKSPDFFGVKSNPKSKFVTTKVDKASTGYLVTGDLTLLGKTKSITFPAKIALDKGALTLESTFKINRSDYGMTYGKGKVDEAVTLTVNVNAKK